MKTYSVLNNSSSRIKITLDKTNFDELKRQMNQRLVAQVGVLGESIHNRKDSTPRKDIEISKTGKRKVGKSQSELSNADIGMIHEFGSVSKNIPRRSFIEMPLTLYLKDEVEKAIPRIRNAFEALDIRRAYALLGIAGEAVILKAFNTQGYGKWAPNSPITIARKGSSKPLIDTAQLRKSINSRVV